MLFESDVKITINKILIFENNDNDRTFYMKRIKPALSWGSHENHFDEAGNYEQALRLIDSNNGCYSGCIIGRSASFKETIDINKVTLDLVERLNKLGMKYSAIAIISRDAGFVDRLRTECEAINAHYNPVSVNPNETDFNRREIDKFLSEYAQRLV